MKAILIWAICLVMLIPVSLVAQPVTRHIDASEPLSDRVQWALQAANGQDANGFWVGYSISKFMHKDSWMGRIGGKNWASRKSLHALLGQSHLEEKLPDELNRNLSFSSSGVFHIGKHHEDEELYLKEVGLLIYYTSRQAGPSDLHMTNMSLGTDLKEKPLFWLGKSTDGESTNYLKSLFRTSGEDEFRTDLLRSVAMHENRVENFDFLVGVLQDDAADELREDAAFWIGQLDLPRGLALLKRVVANDPSMDVREKAVFAIGQMSSDDAQQVLINLARNEKNRDIRKKAIFWLGQQASRNATQVLEDMVFDDADTEVQGHAVHALAQMPAERSIPRLIEIATNHPNVAVRKKAIFWLGDSGDPRAVNVLIELAQKNY